MRATIAALALLTGCSAGAQPMCQYDLYIYQPRDGASLYAISGAGKAAAVEVTSCGDARVLAEAEVVVERLRNRRNEGEISVVTIDGPHSRTYLGPCSTRDEEDEREHDDDPDHVRHDNLVIIEDASGAQMRRMIQSLDAAPRPMREEIISTLALRSCGTAQR